jgi:hypothetical protein
MSCCFSVVTQKDPWTKIIVRAFTYDIYHTWFYHDIDKRGEPLMLVYEENNNFIAFPFIKRKIENSEWIDFTTVYGYSGLLSNLNLDDIPQQMQANFAINLKDFFTSEKVVSVFSRLHPFSNQKLLLQQFDGVMANGKTVYIDLSTPLEAQRKAYHKRLLRQIKQLRNHNYTIKTIQNLEEIKHFSKMYQENMDRLSANKFYYFDEEYFINICFSNEINCKLLAIYDGKEMICGAIIGFSNSIIRNHLSATHVDYTKYSPSKLLTDEISVIGRKLGLNYFHLGGGLGGKQDSLFEFKSYFSPLVLEDYIWCYIANKEAYANLNQQNNSQNLNKYFPSYRNIAAV